MTTEINPIPNGYHTITPSLIVSNATKAIEFYKNALGAEVLGISKTPDGSRVVHSVLKIGDSLIFVNDEFPDMDVRSPQSIGGSPVSLYLYVEDADAIFKKAVDGGATPTMPVAEMFWGDRFGSVTDPFGHRWGFSTHVKDVTPEEVERASKEFFSQTPNETAQKAG